MKISKEFKIGCIIIGIFFFFWCGFQFLKGKNIFQLDNNYYVILNEVTGLKKSNSVTINGLKVGKVQSIIPIINKLNENLTFKVIFSVNQKFSIPINSTILIYEPSIISNKEICIILGNSKKKLKNNQQIFGKINSSLTSEVNNHIFPLSKNINKTLKDLNAFFFTTQIILENTNSLFNEKNKKNIQLLLLNMNKISNDFLFFSESLKPILIQKKNNFLSLIKETESVMNATNHTIKKITRITNKLDNLNLEKTFIGLDKTLDSLSLIFQKINSNKGTLGMLLNDNQIYNKFNSTLNNLNLLLIDLKQSPKRYIHFSIFGRQKEKSYSNDKKNISFDSILINKE